MDKTDANAANPAPEPPEIVRAKLEALQDHTNSGVAIYRAEADGEDFVFVDFNRAAERIEQVSRSELIGKSVVEVFPGVKEFGLFEVFQRVWKTGRPEEHPVSIYRDERIAGWRQNYVCRLPNGHVMAIYDDVTQTKRSELASRMSEQCFRAIANYTYDWEVWIGPTGRVLWTNPAVERVTGYAVKELIALRDYPAPLVHPDDRNRIARAFRSAMRGGSGNDVQFRLQRKDGGIVWAEMSWQPICDNDGNPLGHRQSVRDITARKAAERALARAEREKETILDSLAEHVVHQDVNMKVLWANRAACEAAGVTRAEIIGRPCYEIWGLSEEQCRDCPVAKAMETGRRAEAERTTPDGRVWFIQATPVFNEDGHVVGGVEITLEITAYKRTERELQELREQFRRLKAEPTSRN